MYMVVVKIGGPNTINFSASQVGLSLIVRVTGRITFKKRSYKTPILLNTTGKGGPKPLDSI